MIHDRHIPGDIKYQPVAGLQDVIPMWVADMDFPAPPEVQDTLHKAVDHGIFGYTETDAEYHSLVAAWYRRRMDWDVQPEWILPAPGVMFAISAAIRSMTAPGDSILICQPVYHLFTKIISANDRNLVISELQLRNGKYEIDFADLEQKIRSKSVKVFLLCSPHNPVGRVWTREELLEIGRICQKHHVYIISDEIHSDFVFDGYRHIPIASLSEELSSITVTCTAPTKTFNLAGTQAANMIISDPHLRRKIQHTCHATGFLHLNLMGITATKAAYQYGEPWLDTLLCYLQDNVKLLRDFCNSSKGKLSLIEPEGTYLMWLDCRNLRISDAELKALFLEKARVRLNNGYTFGAGGNGFVRMNIACPKSVLQTALGRIGKALDL